MTGVQTCALPISLAKALVAESLYVNIHSKTNASGEIRGQIKDRIPDTRTTPIKMAAFRAPASRLLFGAGGRALRIQSLPGKVLLLSVTDLQGKTRVRTRLVIESNGFSRDVDAGALRPGLYVAAWGDGSARRMMRFLRQ